MAVFKELFSSILLFCLVFGMSATVDIGQVRKQLGNRNAILTGISLQFLILPFVGFCVVKIFNLSAPVGITLLVITSSPGGSYSNWWCSMFNAELALSVTMTTISTLLSVVMLPVNLVLYATNTYSSDVVKSLDWSSLFLELIVVIGGISLGIITSARLKQSPEKSHRFHRLANKIGNLAGISLITFSVVVSSGSHKSSLWDQSPKFFIGVALPAFIGISIATYMASKFELEKPERVAVAVESCYQNTGIATSVAVAMFSGNDLATAIGVPLYYGLCEAVLLGIFCLICWKIGWTKAPANENICVVISSTYEVDDSHLRMEHHDNIEVVLSGDRIFGVPSSEVEDYSIGKGGLSGSTTSSEGSGTHAPDLIFTETEDGYKIDEESLHNATAALQRREELKEQLEGEIKDINDNTASRRFRNRLVRGRIGRALASVKARATGYRKAPLPSDDYYNRRVPQPKTLGLARDEIEVDIIDDVRIEEEVKVEVNEETNNSNNNAQQHEQHQQQRRHSRKKNHGKKYDSVPISSTPVNEALESTRIEAEEISHDNDSREKRKVPADGKSID